MKNAVMMLNEMFPPPAAAQYKVLSMTGAPNNPTFLMVCCIEGQEFEGSGRSKKEAKLAASQLALSTLFGKVTITHLCHCARFKISPFFVALKGLLGCGAHSKSQLPEASCLLGHLAGT